MPNAGRRPSRPTLPGRIARVAGALVLASLVSYSVADRRGWVLGALAFLLYGTLGVAGALSFSDLRRWSADHVLLDSLLLIPLFFFALLLIPALPWWGAALIALSIGVCVVPFIVRRRTAQQAERGLRQ